MDFEFGPDCSETLNFGVPAPIANAIKRAARNELISKSAYARRAVLAALQRDICRTSMTDVFVELIERDVGRIRLRTGRVPSLDEEKSR